MLEAVLQVVRLDVPEVVLHISFNNNYHDVGLDVVTDVILHDVLNVVLKIGH